MNFIFADIIFFSKHLSYFFIFYRPFLPSGSCAKYQYIRPKFYPSLEAWWKANFLRYPCYFNLELGVMYSCNLSTGHFPYFSCIFIKHLDLLEALPFDQEYHAFIWVISNFSFSFPSPNFPSSLVWYLKLF